MKVGADPWEDAHRVGIIRKQMGNKIQIRVDANGGFSEKDAVEFIRLTREYDIVFYEQLLSGWNLDGTAILRQRYGIPILLDESVSSVQEAVRCIEAKAADAFTIKLCKCGGLYPALKIIGVAAAFGIEAIIASTYDTQIGCAACLHLAIATRNLMHACDLTTFVTQMNQAKTCHELKGMTLSVVDLPGTGAISMDDFKMETVL